LAILLFFVVGILYEKHSFFFALLRNLHRKARKWRNIYLIKLAFDIFSALDIPQSVPQLQFILFDFPSTAVLLNQSHKR